MAQSVNCRGTFRSLTGSFTTRGLFEPDGFWVRGRAHCARHLPRVGVSERCRCGAHRRASKHRDAHDAAMSYVGLSPADREVGVPPFRMKRLVPRPRESSGFGPSMFSR